MENTRIVVLGAGYSGILAARRLALKTRNQSVSITLVNGRDHFVERIRLHQLAANQTLRQTPITRMLRGRKVDFVQGWVKRINAEARTISLEGIDGVQTIGYDYLIYALGSYIDTSPVPGASAYALSVSTHETTLELRQRLPEIAARGGKLVVCGGGLTGIESATELAEAYPGLKVSLVTRENFGQGRSERGAAHLRRAFSRLGIDIIDHATITAITLNQVSYNNTALDYDLCIWAGAFTVPALARDSGLSVNDAGQAVVDDHLRSVSHPDIYVIGDAANPNKALNHAIGMSCQSAIPMGAYAADDLAARLRGKSHRAYDFAYALRCISLGRHDGLVEVVDAEANPKGTILKGWMGVALKEMICRYAFWQIQHDRLVYYSRRMASQHMAAHHPVAEVSHARQ